MGCFGQPLGLITGSPKRSRKRDLGESVELGEGVAALGPQHLGLIQDRRNPLLLRQRREGDL